jgi:hypothetical protein
MKIEKRLELKYIPLKKIRLNNFNVNQLSVNVFNDLEKSLKKYGFVQPITVRQVENDEFEVIDGQHRMIIAKDIFNSDEEVPCVILNMDDEEAMNTVFLLTHTRGEYNQGRGSEIFDGKEGELSSFTGIPIIKIMSYTSPPILFRDSTEVTNDIMQFYVMNAYSNQFLENLWTLVERISMKRLEGDKRQLLSCVLSAMLNESATEMARSKEFLDRVRNEAVILKKTYDNLFLKNIQYIRIRRFAQLIPIENIANYSSLAKCRLCEKKGCDYYETYSFTSQKLYFCNDCNNLLLKERIKLRNVGCTVNFKENQHEN